MGVTKPPQAGAGRQWLRLGLQAGLFVALPPLTAFAIYFTCVHAPAHVDLLIRNHRQAPRIRDGRSAALLSVPVTGLTLLIGVALWPFYNGAADDRLLCVTIQSLAALTLPHMLFETWLDRATS
jgi:Brp/Blh family beta-carotene 15,15'-monooxygenase